MLQNKGLANISTVSWCVFRRRRNAHQLFYLFSYSGSIVVTPGECKVSQLFTLVQ